MGLKEQILVGLEGTLNDKTKKYSDKVNALLSAWELLSVFLSQSSPEASESLFSYVQKYTLQLLLHGDWPKLTLAVKTHLVVTLKHCFTSLSKINVEVAQQCHSIIALVNDPWQHPTLHKILHNLSITEEEVNKFFEVEGSQLLVMRLDVLCEGKCEDLALRLAEACLRYLRNSNVSPPSHFNYVRDVLLALLFRFKRNHDIIIQLKQLDLDEGLQLVQRYAKRSNNGSRVWKHSDKVTEIAAHTILASAMVQCVEDTHKQQLLYDLIKEWALIHVPKLSSSQQTLQNMVRKIIQTAESSLHIYIFCKVLINEFPDNLKPLCIELYIRGLTANMNEVEQQKIKDDKKKIYDSEIRLSDGFLQLADLLQDNIAVCRECVLTAFSLNPTRSCLDRIKALAVACRKPDAKSDFKVNSNNSIFMPKVDVNDRLEKINTECDLDIKSQSLTDSSNLKIESNPCSRHSHLDYVNDRTLKELCSNCGECVNINSSDSSYVTLADVSYCNNLNFLDTESLGLAQHLCDDLSTVLSSPRYQMLSWSMDWLQLSSKCEKYLEEYDSRRNKSTELKYLNIDYSQFKDWPNDEHDISSGIEKGYEQWIDCCDIPEDRLASPLYECGIVSESQDTSQSNITYENKAIKCRREHKKSNLVNELNNLGSRSKRNKKIKYLSTNHYSENKSVDCNSVEHFSLPPDKGRRSRGRKKKNDSQTIRFQRKKKKNLLSYTFKEENCTVTNEMKSLLHKIDGNKNLLNNKINGNKNLLNSNNNNHEKHFSSLLGLNSSVNHTNILKTLRMFRFSENTKSNQTKLESENKNSTVSPVIDITDIRIRDKFLKSAYLNPKVVLTRPDIKYKFNKETGVIKTDKMFDSLDSKLSAEATKLNVKDGKLDILAQAVMSSDILLANSVPGLNSLDMIIPESHEPTVQVVQFPNSATGTLVSQHSVVSVPNDVQNSNSVSLSRIKTNSDNMTTQSTEFGATSTTITNSSNTQTSSPHSITLLAGSVPQSSVPYLSNAESPVVSAEQRTVPTSANCSNFSSSLIPLTSVHLGTMISRQISRGSCTTQTSQAQSPTRSTTLKQFPITSPAPVLKPNQILTVSNQLMNSLVSATQEGSTQVSAHIQKVGHPVKQAKTNDSNTSPLKLSSNLVNAQNTKTADEPLKIYYQTHPTSVFRFIVKDSRIIEEYYPQTYLSNDDLNLLENDTMAQNPLRNITEEEMRRMIKRRKEMATEEDKNFARGSSLPKFHQVFGRQMYQVESIEESSETKLSAHVQFVDSPETKKLDNTVSGSSGLSKAVQTALKGNENDKSADKHKSNDCSGNVQKSNISTGSNTSKSRSAPTDGKTGSDSNLTDTKKVSELQSSPGVIYACNVPVTFGNTSLLQNKPITIVKTSETQKVTQNPAKYEADTSTKESVIRSNMNALLSAALQSPSPMRSSSTTVPCTTTTSVTQASSKMPSQAESKEHVETSVHGIQNVRMPIKTIKRQPVVDQGLQRILKPFVQVSSGTNVSQTCSPVVSCIPLPVRTVQVLTTNFNQGSASSKLENRKESLTLSPVERTPVCSTTLEQLREFESVLEEVTNTSQMKEKCNIKMKSEREPLLSHTIANNEFSVPPAKQDNVFPSSLENTVSDSNERVSLTFISKPSSNCSSTLMSATSPTITTATPVVVVQSCNRPVASSALITPQSSSNSVPSAVGTNIHSRISNKLNKTKSKSVGKTSPTGSAVKVSTLPKPQQKPQEDEQTTQRIYAILDKYAEQLRNSPELKNKPAPRRRSNPPTSTTQSSKRKKSSQSKIKASTSVACSGLELSTGSEDLLTLGSEDSSNGLSQISQVINSPQSRLDEHSTTTGGDVSSETSESLDSKEQRTQHRILLTESSQDAGKAVIVEETLQESTMINMEGSKVLSGKQVVVGNGATIPLTLSLPGSGNVKQVIFPVPADGRQFVVAKVPKMYRVHQVSGSPFLATTSSGTVLFRQMCLNKSNPSVKQMKVPVVSTISSQDLSTNSQPTVVLPSGTQSFTLTTNANSDNQSIGLKLDNTVVLNSSTASSISLVQNNLSTPVHPSPGLLANAKKVDKEETCTSGQSNSNDVTITCLKSKNMSMCSSGMTGDSEEQSEHCSNEKTTATISGWSSTLSRSSYSKSWSQILTDVKNRKNGDKLSKEEFYNKKESIKIIAANNVLKPDFSSQKDTRVIWPTDERKNEREINEKPADSVIKLNQIDVAGEDSACKANVIVGSPEFWHCNISRMEILGKSNKAVSPPSLHEIDSKMVEVDSCIVSNSNRRKGNNVENTILQIAFSKSDKTKPVYIKENIVQQRTLEKEINLQKSLSDECEDLGVDKPSTSDLFPEAELLLEPDPLSRDSLSGGLFSRGVESSSSSHDSPSRSPVLVNRFPASHWKKQKRGLLRRKIPGTENFISESGSKKPSCTVKEPKLASSSSSVSYNSNSATPQFSITSDSEKVLELNSLDRFKCTKSQHMVESCNSHLDDSDIHCNSRDTEIDYNDSDNENCVCSEGEDNYNETDMQDTADSDSTVLQQNCSSKGFHDISGSGQSPSCLKDTVTKLENHLLDSVTLGPCKRLPPLITYNKRSTLKFSDLLPKDLQKNKSSTDLSWNKIVDGVNIKNNVNSDLSDVVVLSEVLCKTGDSSEENAIGEETGSDVNTSNGDMQAFNETSNGSKATLLTSGAGIGSISGRKRKSQSPQKGNKTARTRKGKKINPSLSSGAESDSSIDIVISDNETCQALHRATRRASSRGQIKKGCPCFNGSPEPTKKKKELGLVSKTDKLLSSNSLLAVITNNKKTVNKCGFRNVLKKR